LKGFWGFLFENFVIWWGHHFVVSPGVQLPRAGIRREAICTHTLSSGNVREAQRLRIARVTFPQRLLSGMPLRGDINPKPFRKLLRLSQESSRRPANSAR
jgi:hypothetical protein